MLKWERKNPKKNKEGKEKADKKEKETMPDSKETMPDSDDLENIGLSPSKSLSNISIHGEDGTYISHVSVDDVKRDYGTIHEYLKQRHGPGRYSVTVRGKHGEDTKHISIAGEETPAPWGENPAAPAGLGTDGNQMMGIYFSQQTEIARLKAEVEASKTNVQQSVLSQIVPMAMDFIKTMMQSRPESTNLAEVMTAATESLKTLSEIRTPGDKSDDVGGLMGGIAQLIQGFQQQRQAPLPAYAPLSPPPYIAPPPGRPTSPVAPLTRGVGGFEPAPPISVSPLNAEGFTASPKIPVHKDDGKADIFSLSPQRAVYSPPMSPTPEPPNPDGYNGNYTDVFFENLLGMAEQKQAPKAVAEYLVHSIQKIPPQEIQKLDPQMQILVSQLQVNPVAAFDAICQFEPTLVADGKYTQEVRAELQKLVQG